MNIRKFRKAFGITTAVLILILATTGVVMSFYSNIGGGKDMAEPDSVVLDGRKNIVVFGTDESGLRADVIMIFSFSQKDGTINLVSVPRDTRVKIGKAYQKINSALAIGKEELAIKKVKEVTEAPIHDYATVNFEAVADIIDALGGVEFDVPQDMHYEDPEQNLYIHLKKGVQYLDGDKALQLLRFRKYPTADLRRNEIQQEFMKALFEQKAKAKYIPKIPEIYWLVNKNVTSSMSLSEVTDYAKKIVEAKEITMNTFEMPVIQQETGEFLICDTEKTSKLVDEFFK